MNGTTTLFVALNVLDGQVIVQCQPRHRHIEWLKFLRQIDRFARGVFRSVPELIAAIEEYIASHNGNPKPFVWTAKANDILVQEITKHYTSSLPLEFS